MVGPIVVVVWGQSPRRYTQQTTSNSLRRPDCACCLIEFKTTKLINIGLAARVLPGLAVHHAGNEGALL